MNNEQAWTLYPVSNSLSSQAAFPITLNLKGCEGDWVGSFGQDGVEVREHPVAQIPFLSSQLLIGQKTSRRGLSWGWCFLEKWKCPLEQQLKLHGFIDLCPRVSGMICFKTHK